MPKKAYRTRDEAVEALSAYYPPDLVSYFIKGDEKRGYQIDLNVNHAYLNFLKTREPTRLA